VVIQGPLNESSLSNISNYQKTTKNIVISTWDKYDDSTKSHIPEDPNIVFVASDSGWALNWRGVYYNNANIALQAITTLKGLDKVKTKYAIKVRSDEIYTDISQFAETMKVNKEKLITNNVLFQPDDVEKFHPSDHVIGGTTNNMLGTFEKLENYCAKYAERGIVPLTGKELGIDSLEVISPETLMCICFLQHRGVDISINKSKEIMLSNFDIVPTEKMGRYMIMVKGKPYLKWPGSGNKEPIPPAFPLLPVALSPYLGGEYLLDGVGYVHEDTKSSVFPIESLKEL
jgi:hypothetical protein